MACQGSGLLKKKEKKPDEDMKKKLNWLSSLAIQLMEEQGIHGFAYCSQAYSDKLRDMLPLTNSPNTCCYKSI